MIAGLSILGRHDCCPEVGVNYQVVVGNSPDVNKNSPCVGTHTKSADVFCGLSGRIVGIKSDYPQSLHLCGVVVLEGYLSAPTCYWEMVGSGEKISTTFEKGVSTTESK